MVKEMMSFAYCVEHKLAITMVEEVGVSLQLPGVKRLPLFQVVRTFSWDSGL